MTDETDDSSDEQEEQTVYQCGECGSNVNESSRYCSSCGEKLDTSVF